MDFIGEIHVYQGLTSDEKPTDGIPLGSTFKELDLDRRLWTFTGQDTIDSGWVVQDAGWVDVFNVSDFEAAMLNKMTELITVMKKIAAD